MHRPQNFAHRHAGIVNAMDLMNLSTLGDEYKLWSSSLCNFLTFCVTPFCAAAVAQSVNWLGYGLDERGSIPSRDWEFFSSPPSLDRLWAHPASYPMSTGGSFSGGKAAGAWSYTSTPQYVFMAWYLVEHRENFSFTFTPFWGVDIFLRADVLM
jgi:hypothetical protein